MIACLTTSLDNTNHDHLLLFPATLRRPRDVPPLAGASVPPSGLLSGTFSPDSTRILGLVGIGRTLIALGVFFPSSLVQIDGSEAAASESLTLKVRLIFFSTLQPVPLLPVFLCGLSFGIGGDVGIQMIPGFLRGAAPLYSSQPLRGFCYCIYVCSKSRKPILMAYPIDLYIKAVVVGLHWSGRPSCCYTLIHYGVNFMESLTLFLRDFDLCFVFQQRELTPIKQTAVHPLSVSGINFSKPACSVSEYSKTELSVEE